MAGINFSGLASGLDTDLIIRSLLINKQQRVDNINQKITDQETKKRAFSDVKSALSTFQDAVNGFTDDVFNNRGVSSADESIITATANGSSAIGEYEIEVERLASRSSVSIGSVQSSADATIGGGTLTLNNAGSETFSVTLAAGSTLTDLQTEINDQFGESLQASIIEVSSGNFQLVVSTKETGASLNILDDTDGGNPSSLTGFDAGFLTGGVTSEQTGLDSQIVLNGITINRSGNEIDDVLEGVTLDLNKAEDGTVIKLDISTDLDQAVEKFDELAKGYNDILNQIERVTNQESGVLRGDTDLLNLRRSLQGTITRFVPNIDQINIRDDGSTGITSLAQIGFKTDSLTGDLNIDKEDLREALEDNFDEVKNLFLGNFTSSNANVTLNQANIDTPFSGSITLDTTTDTATVDGENFALNNSNGTLTFPNDSGLDGLLLFSNISNDASVNIELASGLGAILNNAVEDFTKFSGVIDDRTSSIDDQTRELEDQLERAQRNLDNEQNRLTLVFSRAEQAISTLQALQSSLAAQSTGLGR